MKVYLDDRYRWKSIEVGIYNVHYIGCIDELLPVIKGIESLGKKPQPHHIDVWLNKIVSPSAAILESSCLLIAFTDQFCCYPLYYTFKAEGAVSNSARMLSESIDFSGWSTLPSVELLMAGYVTGSDTLLAGLKQMQSGERIIVDIKKPLNINIGRYYRYSPSFQTSGSDDWWLDELDTVMSAVSQRMVERANGRPIGVTLSAGLDSRVIVCKLHEMQYDNLETFSYGPVGNWEARGAKYIARSLGIPWHLISLSRQESYQSFWSSKRRDYWSFADGLSALPNFQEFFPLNKLDKYGLSKDTVLINGQSGDFITGGHIPIVLLDTDATVDTLLEVIINKHYALWRSLMTPDRLEEIRLKIIGLLGVNKNDHLSNEELIFLYERWEAEERQSKWVISGQRVQDFYGYDWQIPLWDIELVKFFEKVPLRLKINQKLYKMWLDRWNYKGLFKDFHPNIWRWPGATLAVVPIAKVIESVFGHNAKKSWYEVMKYWGHTSDHFAPFSYKEYLKGCKDFRNSTALNGRVWAAENGLPSNIVDIGQ